jgi:hypothetical protein
MAALSPKAESLITLLNKLIVGRRDNYAYYDHDKGEAFPARRPLTQQAWADHIYGRVRLGVYQLMPTGVGDDADVGWFCIDVDRNGNWDEVCADGRKILDVAKSVVQVYPERSKGSGLHIWGFHERLPAWKSRGVARAILTMAGFKDEPPTEEKPHYETRVFPKQDDMRGKLWGNLVFAPWFGPQVKDGLTAFLDPATFEPYPNQLLSMVDAVVVEAANYERLVDLYDIRKENVRPIREGDQGMAGAQPGTIDGLSDIEFGKLCQMLKALRAAVENPAACGYQNWFSALCHMVPFADGEARARAFSQADAKRYSKDTFDRYWDSAVRTYIKDHAVQPRVSERIVRDWRKGGSIEVEPINWHYGFHEGCIVSRQYENGEEKKPIPLTNFTARITAQEFWDDGSGQTERRMRIEGALATGRPLKMIEISGNDWVDIAKWMPKEWGTDPIVWLSGGKNRMARILEALAVTGHNAPNRHVYTHSGWVNANGVRAFLTNGSITGCGEGQAAEVSKESEVRLPEALANYSIPTSADRADTIIAYDWLERFIRCADHDTTAPLVAALFLAPLKSALSNMDLSIAVVGKTGTRKSSLVAVALSCYSSKGFTRANLPISFKATSNMIERMCYAAKDVPIVVDNFVPDRKGEAQASLERLAHSVGDGAARGRMRRDETISAAKPARGVVIVTGEDLPAGSSSVARMYVITRCAGVGGDDVEREGGIKLAELGLIQRAALEGKLAPVMTHYLGWLAERLDDPGFIRSIQSAYEEEARGTRFAAPEHGRLAEQAAWIKVGLELAQKSHPGGDWRHAELHTEMVQSLEMSSKVRRNLTRETSLSYKFLGLLRTAVDMGVLAGVSTSTGNKPQAFPTLWGWRHDDTIDGSKYHPRALEMVYIDVPNPTEKMWYICVQPDAIVTMLRQHFAGSIPFQDSTTAVSNALAADNLLCDLDKDPGHRSVHVAIANGSSPRCWKINGPAAFALLGLSR